MNTVEPHTRLLRDHAEIELLLQDLLAGFDSGERTVASSAFQAFDRRLSAHLAFEDEMLLPLLAGIDRQEADEIAAEHRAIRTRVETLAIADNLHLSRASEIHALVELLRAHARREEAALYWLADRAADQPTLRDRLDWLFAANPPTTNPRV